MSSSVNEVTILGRLGGDPELKYTPNGTAVAQFSVATSEKWKDKQTQQDQEKTEWHRIVVWGKLAEICNQYLKKGKQVFLKGSLQTRSWDDKNGQKRYTTEIVVKDMVMCGDRSEGGGQRPGAGAPPPSEPQGGGYNMNTDPNFTPEDIPF